MKADILDSVNELKKIFTESQNRHLFFVVPKNFSEDAVNVAKSDRDKMVEILNQFYRDHSDSFEGIDNFVTLFGICCNYYIIYGLHLILKEDDFGTAKIFENISDASLKEYLSLIQAAVCKQDNTLFEEAVKKNEKYSLAHFYLFLARLRNYYGQRDYKEQEEKLLYHYKAIRNAELQKYAIGRSDFTPNVDKYLTKLAIHNWTAMPFLDPDDDETFKN